MASKKTNADDFLSELEAGNFKGKLEHMLSEVALGQVIHGSGNRKGKVSIELSFQQVGENNQVIVSSKVSFQSLTKRGAKAETATNETPFFVGKGGVLTIEQPKEEYSGQFGLVSN